MCIRDRHYTSLTPDRILNSLMYRTLFYVNIYGSYKLSKNSPVFLAHPVYTPVRITGVLVEISLYRQPITEYVRAASEESSFRTAMNITRRAVVASCDSDTAYKTCHDLLIILAIHAAPSNRCVRLFVAQRPQFRPQLKYYNFAVIWCNI